MRIEVQDNDVMALAKDFERWGVTAVDRILNNTAKYGVLCNSNDFMRDGKG